MIKKEEILDLHKRIGLPLSTIEKDYVLGLLIWAIAQNSNLRSDWIFKGGTCLKKCYFGNYRFSEDLDYTIRQTAIIDQEFLRNNLIQCFNSIYEQFGVKIEEDNLSIIPFSDKKFIQIKIPYHGPLMISGSLPKVKLDLSGEEILIQDPIERPLIHGYSDKVICNTMVMCYSVYEIFAEKLRALVQRTRPRDLYDVINLYDLFRAEQLDKSILREVASKKFYYKQLEFPTALRKIQQRSFEEARMDWKNMLDHQVQPLENIEIYLDKLSLVIQGIE